MLTLFAQSLAADDRVVLEATGNALAIARLIAPHVAEVVLAHAKQVRAISHARIKTDRRRPRELTGAWRTVVRDRNAAGTKEEPAGAFGGLFSFRHSRGDAVSRAVCRRSARTDSAPEGQPLMRRWLGAPAFWAGHASGDGPTASL
jgi:hypothetical protein